MARRRVSQRDPAFGAFLNRPLESCKNGKFMTKLQRHLVPMALVCGARKRRIATKQNQWPSRAKGSIRGSIRTSPLEAAMVRFGRLLKEAGDKPDLPLTTLDQGSLAVARACKDTVERM